MVKELLTPRVDEIVKEYKLLPRFSNAANTEDARRRFRRYVIEHIYSTELKEFVHYFRAKGAKVMVYDSLIDIKAEPDADSPLEQTIKSLAAEFAKNYNSIRAAENDKQKRKEHKQSEEYKAKRLCQKIKRVHKKKKTAEPEHEGTVYEQASKILAKGIYSKNRRMFVKHTISPESLQEIGILEYGIDVQDRDTTLSGILLDAANLGYFILGNAGVYRNNSHPVITVDSKIGTPIYFLQEKKKDYRKQVSDFYRVKKKT